MTAQSSGVRPYDRLAERVASDAVAATSREAVMESVTQILWEGLRGRGVSWVGFYTASADRQSLELGPHRDSPACTPIELHGVCGQAFTQRTPQVVEDVRALGESYIACDPRDRSEVVIPLFDPGGEVWGVFDVDSHEVGAFSQADVDGLRKVLAAGFGERAVSPDSR